MAVPERQGLASQRWRAPATVGLFMAAAAYLLQHVRMAPNQVDGGLLLDYVARVAAGQRPFADFVDVYGPWTWPPLAAGFRLLGDRVLGARLALWLLKLACLGCNFALVRRHAGWGFAAWATAALTVALGLPWQVAHDPYPYAQALACELGCLHLCLLAERGASLQRLGLAGALAATALLTKLNTGVYLLAAASLHLWQAHGTAPRSAHPLARAAGLGVLGLAAAAVLLFVRAHLTVAFALYLLVPIGLSLGQSAARDECGPSRPRLVALAGFLGVALATFAAGLVLSVGAEHAPRYLGFQLALLARLRYAAGALPPGTPGVFVGFNEHGWPQLPWLVSAAYAALVMLTYRRQTTDAGRAAHAAFGLFAWHQLVIYSRADEAHVYQALLLVPATAALTLHALGAELARRGAPLARWPARVGAALACAAALDLGALAQESALTGPGDWGAPRMRGLAYRRANDPHVRAAITHMTERDEDAAADAAARHIRSRIRPGEPILALNRNTLVGFAAGASPAGGRHAYLLYLLRNGFLSLDDVAALAPPDFIRQVRRSLPRVLIGSIGGTELEKAIPGLDLWVLHYYERTGVFGPLIVYERRPDVPP